MTMHGSSFHLNIMFKMSLQRLRCHQKNDVMFITNAFCITYNDHWSVIKKLSK